MLEVARDVLGPGADLRPARLEDDLPPGPFDLVVSALAIHHLHGPGKADLFRRIRAALAPDGRFIMGDVVIPERPVDDPSPLDPAVDRPDRLADLLAWLRQAGFDPEVTWAEGDLVVIACPVDRERLIDEALAAGYAAHPPDPDEVGAWADISIEGLRAARLP